MSQRAVSSIPQVLLVVVALSSAKFFFFLTREISMAATLYERSRQIIPTAHIMDLDLSPVSLRDAAVHPLALLDVTLRAKIIYSPLDHRAATSTLLRCR